MNNNSKMIKQNNINKTSNKVVLFANVKDEKHIREWVAHHLLIGFDCIIIFDHNSQIPLNKTLAGFNNKMVKIIDISKFKNPIKIPLMNYAVSIAKSINADWMLYLDADEFLIFNNKNMGVKQFLNNYKNIHSLGINWLMFGSNNLKTDPDGLILENYTKSELILNKHVKSFVRPTKVLKVENPHYFVIGNDSYMYGINNKKITTPFSTNEINLPCYKVSAYIAHYSIQSEETFYKRKCRPMDDTGQIKNNINDIIDIHKKFNNIENLYPKKIYAERIKSFLSNYNYKF